MLDEIEIRHLGPIHHAHVSFSPFMTAITGETGAGKSMLLSALKLIQGDAASTARITTGSTETWVQAIFDATDYTTVSAILDDAGLISDDQPDQLFITRHVPTRGRAKAVVNGYTVPNTVLKRLTEPLIIIHGQSDQIRLVSSARQRAFLDRYADTRDLAHQYADLWNEYQEKKARVDALQNQQAEARQRADYLRDSLHIINSVNPQPHEEDTLQDQRGKAEHSALVVQALHHALQLLDASDYESEATYDMPNMTTSLVDCLHDIDTALRPISSFSEISSCLNQLSDISTMVATISDMLTSQLQAYDDISNIDIDTINERIHELHELTRRWGPSLDDVLAWKQDAEKELDSLDTSPEKIHKLTEEADNAYQNAYQVAQQLHQQRLQASQHLADEVNQELCALAFKDATFSIHFDTLKELSATGLDTITFLFSAFHGAPAQTFSKAASGGELSRLMLALELCVARQTQTTHSSDNMPRRTFIFDEVDSGVGGQTAVELGKRLAQLAQHEQVIVVTHLPQVASWAQQQCVVEKTNSDHDTVETTVRTVHGTDRETEIARMLSGTSDTLAQQHAHQLLANSVLSHKEEK